MLPLRGLYILLCLLLVCTSVGVATSLACGDTQLDHVGTACARTGTVVAQTPSVGTTTVDRLEETLVNAGLVGFDPHREREVRQAVEGFGQVFHHHGPVCSVKRN